MAPLRRASVADRSLRNSPALGMIDALSSFRTMAAAVDPSLPFIVLYWYGELSSSWKFLEWFFGTFFCRRFAWGVGAPHARTLSATKTRGFFHWARCARKLTQSRLCPLRSAVSAVPAKSSASPVFGTSPSGCGPNQRRQHTAPRPPHACPARWGRLRVPLSTSILG